LGAPFSVFGTSSLFYVAPPKTLFALQKTIQLQKWFIGTTISFIDIGLRGIMSFGSCSRSIRVYQTYFAQEIGQCVLCAARQIKRIPLPTLRHPIRPQIEVWLSSSKTQSGIVRRKDDAMMIVLFDCWVGLECAGEGEKKDEWIKSFNKHGLGLVKNICQFLILLLLAALLSALDRRTNTKPLFHS
jgi:hypothetical protein